MRKKISNIEKQVDKIRNKMWRQAKRNPNKWYEMVAQITKWATENYNLAEE